ncbi:hypothetical protein A1Q2_02907 [Trichosporon asahii var. asahii CBS 8904]|uniref:Eisosome component PIL1-domain-containing protein n=1 Tax=Trichosporon asahii var. asahii (strain CBS 8904) TaxID=1220162 RepID=K1VSY8_TRIAC|nr:hypothetical protein A1Q2_02907 [Trichosporon asahii var. asahii CBS 8904]
MALRSASGKFGLPSFGRRRGSDSQPQSRIVSGAAPTSGDESLASPTAGNSNFAPTHAHTHSGGGGSGTLGGIGNKLGKKVAHTSLLPALGNQDLRALQDVISSEKDVLKASEKMAQETASAASKLAPYGQSEGPDLQDVLTHSASLLTRLSDAYRTFAQHEANLRVCFKRIREREENLDQKRRQRRQLTHKAEQAERKLSKMGAENKQLLQQTELLESLRKDMRDIDADIVVEESKLGDFKRQMVKEAMSYKFGGLEELGEKMCIVGELGKLLLEEIPLEETPPGYGRAPYEGYERTDKTEKEALRCLSQVQFHAASAAPKPPGLPGIHNSPLTAAAAGNGPVPEASIAQREEYGDYVPGTGASSPRASSPPRIPAISGLDDRRPSEQDEYGATHTAPTGTVWQGPSDDALEHSYEYEQQRQMDAAAAQDSQANSQVSSSVPQIAPTPYGAPIAERFATTTLDSPPEPAEEKVDAPKATPGWEPLRVSNRDSTGASLQDQPRYSLHDGPRYSLHDGPVPRAEEESEPVQPAYQEQANPYLAAPAQGGRPVTADGYYTPDNDSVVAIPAEIPSPTQRAHPSIPPSTSAEGLAYDDEPVVTIPDQPASPSTRRLPDPPTQPSQYTSTQIDTPGQYEASGFNYQSAPVPGDVPVVVIHDKPSAGGYRPPASPPRSRVASPDARDDALNQALDSYYAPGSNVTTPVDEKRSSFTPATPASNGVISAAAFRRGAKQRPSFNEEDKPNVPDSPPPGYH